jgi:DNA invertase Pin-like site-specific DNA recombinase
MTALLIGYARCSTDQQDLTAQRNGLAALGVALNRVYVDHGLTGTNRERPGMREALAACREGDTLVARQARPAGPFAARRAGHRRRAHCSTGASEPGWVGVRPDGPGRPVAVLRARDGCRVRVRSDSAAHPRGHEGRQGQRAHLRGKQPKLNARQVAHLVALFKGGEYSTAELADLFGVARSTVYRACERERARAGQIVGTVG